MKQNRRSPIGIWRAWHNPSDPRFCGRVFMPVALLNGLVIATGVACHAKPVGLLPNAAMAAVGIIGYAHGRGIVAGHGDATRVAEEHAEATKAERDAAEARRLNDLLAQHAAEKAAERATRNPCQITINVNPAQPGEGYLYALKFSTGTVKVGQTNDLRRRITEHRRDADAYNVTIVDYWVSPAHDNYQANEIELIAYCLESAPRSRREYFHGIDFDDVVRFGRSLPYFTATKTSIQTGQDIAMDTPDTRASGHPDRTPTP